MNRNLIITVVVGLALLTAAILYMTPVWQTESKLSYAVGTADRNDQDSGETEVDDYWGNKILLIRENNKEANYIKYIAYSAGRDQIYNTDDDIKDQVINRNWSKKAGAAAGKITTEAIKGFKETFKKKSRHDKE